MCGRYSLTSRLDQLLPRLQGPLPEGLLEVYRPRRQVRPGDPLLLQRAVGGRLAVRFALWGLVPSWLKDPSRRSRPINARSETAAKKPYSRGAWRHRRCLLPADGFYEWRPTPAATSSGRGRKPPYWIHRIDGAPFWLVGLWERWLGADGTELDSRCVLTTRPNALLRPIHDRIPVLIPDVLEEPWLLASGGP